MGTAAVQLQGDDRRLEIMTSHTQKGGEPRKTHLHQHRIRAASKNIVYLKAMSKNMELASSLVASPPLAGSVASTEGSASSSSSSLHPAGAAALHHLALSVDRARERLRRPCVHVAASAADRTHRQTHTHVNSDIITAACQQCKDKTVLDFSFWFYSVLTFPL